MTTVNSGGAYFVTGGIGIGAIINSSGFESISSGGIASGKTAVARSAVAALGVASGHVERAAVVADAVSEYYVARQMWDDLTDWRKDLAAGQCSLLLARAIQSLPPDSSRG